MSESPEVPEKRETPEPESPHDEFQPGSSSRASPDGSGADETGEETEDILLEPPEDELLLELPEDELLDLPQAQGVTVTSRTGAGDEDEESPTPPSRTIEEGDSDRAGVDLADDTDSLTRRSVEAGDSGTPVEESPSTDSDKDSHPTAAVSPDASSASAEDQGADASTEDASTASETAEAPILVRAPAGADVFALSELILEPSGRPLGVTAARWIGRLLEKLEEAASRTGETDEPQIAAWIRETVAPAIHTGEPPAEAEETFVFAASEAAEETSVRNRLKGNGKSKSLLGELVGIVLGGLGGLLIAYYALNWFGGSRYDFANIPLPGVRHTYRHAPAWLKPYLQPGKHPEQKGAGDVSSPEL